MRLVDADHLVFLVNDATILGDSFKQAFTAIVNGEPTIDPVRKGKWIFVHPLQDNDSGAYMCSVCNTGDWDIKPTDKYCKFCGAKMGDE